MHAPIERVWRLLTTPVELERWAGVRIVRAPNRQLEPGDQVLFGAGMAGMLTVVFHVREADPLRRLTLDVHLPLGVINYEKIVIARISDTECRATFN